MLMMIKFEHEPRKGTLMSIESLNHKATVSSRDGVKQSMILPKPIKEWSHKINDDFNAMFHCS